MTKAELLKLIAKYPDNTLIVLSAKNHTLECFVSPAASATIETISIINEKMFVNRFNKTLYAVQKAILIKA